MVMNDLIRFDAQKVIPITEINICYFNGEKKEKLQKPN